MNTAIILEDLPHAQLWLSQSLQLAFPGIQVARADCLLAGLQLLNHEHPEICLVDMRLPDGSGIDFIRECRKQHPDCKIVVTSIFDDDNHIFPALEAGAVGYLLKEEPQPVLAEALRGLLNNQPPLSATVARQMITFFNKNLHRGSDTHGPHEANKAHLLTRRQREILRSIAEGKTSRDIAEVLDISAHTVSQHVKNIYHRLDINSRAEAVQEAIRMGLLQP